MNYYEKTVKTEPVYEGSIIRVERLTVELPNEKLASRDIVRNSGAAAVVPFLDDQTVILVEQFRKPNEMVSLEIPAGKMDPGEDPLTCAQRELQEETGYCSGNFRKLIKIHATPAYSDEVLHLYLATGLTQGPCSPDDDEFLSVKNYPVAQVIKMIEEGVITDSKTVAGILFAARILGL